MLSVLLPPCPPPPPHSSFVSLPFLLPVQFELKLTTKPAVNATTTVIASGTGIYSYHPSGTGIGSPIETFTGAASSLNAVPAMGFFAVALAGFFGLA